MNLEALTPDQVETAQQIAVTANEKIDSASLGNATQALNLGCTLTLVPGLILVTLVLILSHFNWVMACIALVLVVIFSLIFANLVSTLARQRSIQRIYRQEVGPEIERSLTQAEISWEQFESISRDLLPMNAPLLADMKLRNHMEPKEE